MRKSENAYEKMPCEKRKHGVLEYDEGIFLMHFRNLISSMEAQLLLECESLNSADVEAQVALLKKTNSVLGHSMYCFGKETEEEILRFAKNVYARYVTTKKNLSRLNVQLQDSQAQDVDGMMFYDCLQKKSELLLEMIKILKIILPSRDLYERIWKELKTKNARAMAELERKIEFDKTLLQFLRSDSVFWEQSND